MTITLELPPELEKRFLAEAQEKGMTLNAYLQERLTRPIPRPALHHSNSTSAG
jgi:predicted HicB family RNase H-like nuclease